MATGTITVSASGGSGNYNYKVTGPINTPFTSSAVISGLSAGTYTVVETIRITRQSSMKSGLYLLKVYDLETKTESVEKLVFE